MASKICPKCKTAIPKIKIKGIFALINCPECKTEITVFKDARLIEAEREKDAKDFYAKKIHDIRGNSIYPWIDSAKNLLCASRLLEDQFKKDEPITNYNSISFNASGVNIMLKAFSLECIFKAIWLNKGNKLIDDGKLIAQFKTHDLSELSRIVGVCGLNVDEKRLLKYFSQFSIVYGRYPIPTSYKNSNGLDFPVHQFEIFKNIINKLLKCFPPKNDYQLNLDYIHELIS
jgi:hypothetical protein